MSWDFNDLSLVVLMLDKSLNPIKVSHSAVLVKLFTSFMFKFKIRLMLKGSKFDKYCVIAKGFKNYDRKMIPFKSMLESQMCMIDIFF